MVKLLVESTPAKINLFLRVVAGAGGAGHADNVGPSGARVDLFHHGADHGRAILDQRDQTGEREAIVRREALEQ